MGYWVMGFGGVKIEEGGTREKKGGVREAKEAYEAAPTTERPIASPIPRKIHK